MYCFFFISIDVHKCQNLLFTVIRIFKCIVCEFKHHKIANMAEKNHDGPNLPSIFDDLWKTYQYTEKTDDASVSGTYQV